ncbi:MAG: hypothetical protein PHQ12_01115 [Chthoniobacteraceae bacterium]|nr:hypothetical protein [Chthoniobacteraceae bacterium]
MIPENITRWALSQVIAIGANTEEIATAIQALDQNSAIAEKRAARALVNAMAHGNAAKLPDNTRKKILNLIPQLPSPWPSPNDSSQNH